MDGGDGAAGAVAAEGGDGGFDGAAYAAAVDGGAGDAGPQGSRPGRRRPRTAAELRRRRTHCRRFLRRRRRRLDADADADDAAGRRDRPPGRLRRRRLRRPPGPDRPSTWFPDSARATCSSGS